MCLIGAERLRKHSLSFCAPVSKEGSAPSGGNQVCSWKILQMCEKLPEPSKLSPSQ